jgi:hypothetical protein
MHAGYLLAALALFAGTVAAATLLRPAAGPGRPEPPAGEPPPQPLGQVG